MSYSSPEPNYGNRSPNTVASFNNSTGAQSKARKAYHERTLIPVTIRMLLNSTPSIDNSGVVLPDGRETHEIKMVAAVRNMEVQSTSVNYTVEDGTGVMEVKKWTNDSDNIAPIGHDQPQPLPDINSYVRILGQAKDFNGTRNVSAHCVRSVTTGNELTHHVLEVVFSAKNHEKKAKGGGGGVHDRPPQSNTMMSPYGTNTSMADNNFLSSPSTALNMNQHFSAQGGGGVGGNEMEHAVLDYVRTQGADSDLGVTRDSCVRSLAGRYTEAQIRKCLEDLSSNGELYTTLDDNHVKAC